MGAKVTKGRNIKRIEQYGGLNGVKIIREKIDKSKR